MNSSQLSSNEYLSYYGSYIRKARNVDLINGLEEGLIYTTPFLKTIAENKLEYRYADNK